VERVFSTLAQQANSARLPEAFWADFSRACEHLRTRKLFIDLRPDLKPDVDAVLRAYIRHNGNYRSNALLPAAILRWEIPQQRPPGFWTWLRSG